MSRQIAIVNSSIFGTYDVRHVHRLEALGTVQRMRFPTSASSEELVRSLKDVHVVILSVSPTFSAETIDALPRLEFIARHGVGCDNIDLGAATRRGIPVSRVEGMVEQAAVAEHTIGLMLAACRFMVPAVESVRANRWDARSSFVGRELHGARVGVIGLGAIGTRVAEILTVGFRSEVVAYDPSRTSEEYRRRHAAPVSLEELLASSDIVTLHASLNPGSYRLLSRERLLLMKRGAVLVNTARGALVDEHAVKELVCSGHLTSYATDVVEGTRTAPGHHLVGVDRIIVTPHISAYTSHSLTGMGESVVSALERWYGQDLLPETLANPAVVEVIQRTRNQ